MKSVGEAMSIGRTFKESLQKGLRSLEIKVHGLEDIECNLDKEGIFNILKVPSPDRIFHLKQAFKLGMTTDEIFNVSKIDRWFLTNIKEIVDFEKKLEGYKDKKISATILRVAKQFGFSDIQLAKLWDLKEEEIRKLRNELNISPEFKQVDTCAAEFEAYTPYYYSSYS